MRTRRVFIHGTIAALLVVVTGGPLAVAATAPEATDVFEREVLQTKLSPAGELRQSRLYSQLTVEGDGEYSVVDPTSTEQLRNLNGFSRPATADDAATWNLSVDGSESLRTVADYSGELPLQVSAEYALDGEPMDPDELVGRSGELTATYRVKNVSTRATELTFEDAYGEQRTETVDLPLPLAGQFESTLSKNFTDVVADGLVVAGDGRGNTKLKYTLILFEPLGGLEQEFGYTAQVTDMVVPPATVQVVPVTIDQAPLSSGNAAYTDAAASTLELTQGATTIDENLFKLADGAGQLLDGIVKLSSGAAQLNDGLGDAATGAGKLSDGLLQADQGGTDLGEGLVKLRDGSIKLSAGMSRARAGGAELAAGLGRLDAGAGKLADGAQRVSDGLGAANEGGAKLAAGVKKARAGAQRAATGATKIEDGMRRLEAGLLALADDPAKLPALIAGIEQFRSQALGRLSDVLGTETSTFVADDGSTVPSSRTIVAKLRGAGPHAGGGLPAAIKGVGDVSQALKAGATDARAGADQLLALNAGQIATINGVRSGLGCPATGTPVEAACTTLTALSSGGSPPSLLLSKGGLEQVRAGADKLDGANGYPGPAAAPSLDYIASRLGSGTSADPGALAALAGLEQQLAALKAAASSGGAFHNGLDKLVGGVEKVRKGVRADAAGNADIIADFQAELAEGLELLAGKEALGAIVNGAGDLSDGLNQLDAGAAQLAAGGQELADGAGAAADGSGELSDGLGQLEDGSQQLAAGNGEAAAGGAKLSDGLGLLSDGAFRLANGLTKAEDGSGRLADGLGQAKDGGGKIADGAHQLNEQGTSKLASSVNDANADQNRNVALVQAMDERSREEGMPAGAPEGATSSAVYAFELAGADGVEQQNRQRLALTGAALAVMAGLGLVRRRLFNL